MKSYWFQFRALYSIYSMSGPSSYSSMLCPGPKAILKLSKLSKICTVKMLKKRLNPCNLSFYSSSDTY
uniref:Uncharacterized protein n=1 Tax=Picea sitchensis TaxID=3332 RepID=A0A6B9XV84_PICSI|nr:hypothetical protein Q903MT_gene6889 [Picea sitchensis]